MKSPLVSVVMATYHGDNHVHLQDAIRSVLEQSYEKIELILVVDGQVPSERQRYLDKVAMHNNVRLIYKSVNVGPAAARNEGILAAGGEFIAIMDADDICLPDRITHQLSYLVEHELDMMSSWLTVIDDIGQPLGVREVPVTVDEVRRLAPFRCPMHNPAAFGRAQVFKSHLYNASYRVSEDYDLWVRLLMGNYRLGNSKKSCVLYRQSRQATAKRLGLKYAIADMKVKIQARHISSLGTWPFIIGAALISSCMRLLPKRSFQIVYSLRMKKLGLGHPI